MRILYAVFGVSLVLPVFSGVPTNTRSFTVADGQIEVQLWTDSDDQTNYYQIVENGQVLTTKQSDTRIKLRYDSFDPLISGPRNIDSQFTSRPENQLFVVQFHTQALESYRTKLDSMGVQIYKHLPSQAYVVRMGPHLVNAVANQPFVRWVGPYEPAYRLENFIIDHAQQAEDYYPLQRYNIMIWSHELDVKEQVAAKIFKLGGLIDRDDAGKYLIEATLTPEQLFEVVHFNEIQFIDRWSPGEADMDISREITGVNYLETMTGYTGQDVRGEIIDLGFNMTHVDFNHHPLIEHTAVNSDSHGASCSGIVFADGTGNPMGRGILPDGQGIVADWDVVSVGMPRYTHTGELPQAPYNAVFQTASVGSARTFFYTTISADTDSALFDFDILHCQSQSNAGNQDSRPQAWAKNILSGGAVNHQNTLTKADDCWCSGGSIGPGQDGRIKPDLCHFYDATFTTTTGSTTAYTANFGGTSGATPNICGNTGLFFQMWSEGTFGNPFDPGGSVFSNRPHMTTAKAAMINTADQYVFSGQAHDLTRVHQGWGMPSPRNLYDQRTNMFFVDEEDVLSNMQSISYTIVVSPGEPELKVTMIFADPPGNPAAAEARINNLDLKVTAPDMTEYWGNVGLLDGNYSTAGGTANSVDTVENVFIQNPASGNWTVEVTAAELVEDGHTETEGVLDADFALVVSGGVFFGFRMSMDNSIQSVCSPNNATYDVNIDPAAGFTEPVTLSTSGLPAGLTPGFSVNPIMSGTSVLTLTGTGSVAPGSYPFTVTAMSASVTATRNLILNVFDAIPSVPTLQTPSNGAVDVALRPTLTWAVDANAVSYRVQLASDMGFTNIIEDQVVTTNSYDVSTTLNSLTTYYWRALSSNTCGDSSNATAFSFTTLDQPIYFTELFGTFDLENHTTAFEPDGTGNYYTMCGWASASFPTDPAGGTNLGLGEDAFVEVVLNQPFNFYGSDYSSIFVGSNGYITFNSGDTQWTESLDAHFGFRRISAHFDDYSPHLAGGAVTVRQLADRVAVTWENVTGYNVSNSNNFQLELFHDGRIHITHLQMDETDGLVGLSNGGGTPGDFIQDDLSAAPMTCEQVAPCPWDITGDTLIDMDDVIAMYPDWHNTLMNDINMDGVINLIDYLLIMNNFGACP